MNKSTINKIVKLYSGNKKVSGIGVRKISKELQIPRRQVMRTVEEAGLNTFSPLSYK